MKYLALYMPWAIVPGFKTDPHILYHCVARVIFYFLYNSKRWVKPYRKTEIAEQLMRPIFLVQIIFAGYMCCTTIFYFLNVLGMRIFTKQQIFPDRLQKLKIRRNASVIIAWGMQHLLPGIDFHEIPDNASKYYMWKQKSPIFFSFLHLSLCRFHIFFEVSGLSQFAFQFSSLSFIAGHWPWHLPFPQKKIWNTLICLFCTSSTFTRPLFPVLRNQSL